MIEYVIGGVVAAIMIVGGLCWTYMRGYVIGYRAALDKATQINREIFHRADIR